VGAKVVAQLSDQVEAKIARANRAFRLSSRIIAATQQELESHGEWLDRHRVSWAEEVKRHHRLLNRKLALGAVTRFVVGLVFAAPFALARAIERRLEPRASPDPRPHEAEPPFTREAALDLRIGRLEERLAATPAAAPRASSEHIEKPKTYSPRPASGATLAPGADARPRTDRVSTRAIAALALLIVAAGVLRAIFSSPPADETARVAQDMIEPGPGAPATLTVVKSKRAEPPPSHSGFAVIEAAPRTEVSRAPPQTIADMIAMADSLPLPSVAAEEPPQPAAAERPQPVAGERPQSLAAGPVAPKPTAKAKTAAAKAKPKRKVAARDPEPLPWWQEWSWIKVR
jgi:hypothetical protein